MKIYILRHGERIPNKQVGEKESLNLGLTKHGRNQVRASANFLKNKIEHIVSSPIIRTKESAEILSEVTGLPINYNDNLKEFFAELNSSDQKEGKRLKEYARAHPDEPISGRESLNHAIDRLKKVIEGTSQLSYKAVCLVTHRVIVEGMLAREWGVNKTEQGWLRNASITAIDVKSGKAPKLLYYDRRIIDWQLFIDLIKRRFLNKYE